MSNPRRTKENKTATRLGAVVVVRDRMNCYVLPMIMLPKISQQTAIKTAIEVNHVEVPEKS